MLNRLPALVCFSIPALLLGASIACRAQPAGTPAYDPAWYPDPTSGDFVLFGGDLPDGNYSGGHVPLRMGQHHIPGRHFIAGDGWWVIACAQAECNLRRTSLEILKNQHPTYDGPTVPSQVLIWNPLPYGLSIDRQELSDQSYRPRRASDATLLAIFKPIRASPALHLEEGNLTTWWYARKQIEELRDPYASHLLPPAQHELDIPGHGRLTLRFERTSPEKSPRIRIEYGEDTQDLGEYEPHMGVPDRMPLGEFVQWIGDLDADGRPDLLINHSAYYWDIRLWLSGKAKPGELVGEAGRFNYSPPDSPGC
jgi:hypothetical protein